MRTNRGFIGVRGLGEAKKRRVAELLHRVFAEHRAGKSAQSMAMLMCSALIIAMSMRIIC